MVENLVRHYDFWEKKESWTIEEVMEMLFPIEFFDEGLTLTKCKIIQNENEIWYKTYHLILSAIENNSITYSQKVTGNIYLKVKSVLEWFEFERIFIWLNKRGWKKPDLLTKMIGRMNQNKVFFSRDYLEDQINFLKCEIQKLQSENKILSANKDSRGKHFREDRIKILEAALKMVDYNNKELFHKKGNLNASQLAKLVDDYRLAIGLEEGKLKYETIKGHISGALKSPKSSPSKD